MDMRWVICFSTLLLAGCPTESVTSDASVTSDSVVTPELLPTPDDSLVSGFEVQGVFQGETPAFVDGGLGRAVGQRRAAGQAIGPCERRALELGARDDAVHEADAESLVRVDELAQEQELERLRRSDQLGQEVRGAAGWP